MANDEERAFSATIPTDTKDPPRFGQPQELVKDVFVEELRKFFQNSYISANRREELPTVEKYSYFTDGNDQFTTGVEIVKKFPDIFEKLPLVAVSTNSLTEKKLTIGPPIVAGTVQDPPRLIAIDPEPYALVAGSRLALRTVRSRQTAATLERVIFADDFFADISAATAEEVAQCINIQTNTLHATTEEIDEDIYLVVTTRNPVADTATPTELECYSETDSSVLDAFGFGTRGDVDELAGTVPDLTLDAVAGSFSAANVDQYVCIDGSEKPYFNDGRFLITDFSTDNVTDTITYTNKYGKPQVGGTATWFIGNRDDHRNVARPPKRRYGVTNECVLAISVYTTGDNSRTELVDLISTFFGFSLEEKYFSMFGRSVFNGSIGNEHWQIIINPPMGVTSESEAARPGDTKDKVYMCVVVLNVTVSQYLDRTLYHDDGSTPFIFDSSAISQNTTLPLPSQTEDES